MVREAGSRLLCTLGADRLASAFQKGRVLVVMYHGIVATQLRLPCPWQTEVALFRQQIEWLVRHRSVMSLDECVRRIGDGDPLPPRPAVVTFDDGYRSVRTRALPILEDLAVPATVFVVTGELGPTRLLWHDALYLAIALTDADELVLGEDGAGRYNLGSAGGRREALAAASTLLKPLEPLERERNLSAIAASLGVDPTRRAEREEFALLSANEVRAMARGGSIAFGAHGVTHVSLPLLPEAAVERAVNESVTRLRELAGTNLVPFAYPFGEESDVDGTVAHLVRAGGATCALTAVPGLNSPGGDLFALRRIGVGAGVSLRRFRLRVSAVSGWGFKRAFALAAERVARARSWLRPLRRLWRDAVYRADTVHIFARQPGEGGERLGPTGTDTSFRFGRSSAAELGRSADRLAPRDTAGFLNRAAERFADGMVCLVLRRGTGIVALVWVSEAPRARITEIERTIDIGADSVYLFDAFTVPEWRGRGLYPLLLDHVSRLYGGRPKVIAASSRNEASLGGIRRAGFTPVACYRFLKIAGLVIRGRSPGGVADRETC